jgi:hypothetical protein
MNFAGHLEIGEDHDLLDVRLLGGAALRVSWTAPGALVLQVVLADVVALSGYHRGLAIDVPGGAGEADEHRNDAQMHDITAISSAIFLDQPHQRKQR